MSPRTVMEWQAAALFRHDAAGRLLGVNEPGDPPAPRLFVGRTVEGNLWRFRYDLPQKLMHTLDGLLAAEPVVADVRQPLACSERLREALSAYAPIAGTEAGPAWWCPEGIASQRAIPTVCLTNAAPAERTFPWLAAEFADRAPCVAVLEAGEVVSLCLCSRRTPVVAEAGLITLEKYRRRGYAAATVAAWAAAVRATGRLPLYSTSWENLASQAVAKHLGLICYGADLSYA